ncbi:hypothetical protein K435DRAFT_968784 [Dendrothele bispora CBS 962.96]|uniref:Uncharacterized protein n=1 Tax=Dendrothele bispora (strain CBS 962.96) TaxID=1314807 RepID=A0A4V4HEC3_DENBC|nr:hypothetical protein K435DRAFT_968784 [Dendrothele bispora CBS 962.96]
MASSSDTQPTSLSPEDNLVLSHVGTVSINNFIANTCQMFSYGIFVLLFSFSLNYLLRKRLHSKAQKILFALTLFLFLTYTSFIAITIAEFVISVREVLQSNDDMPLAPRLLISNLRVVPLVKYVNWSQTLNVLCGDSVVVWRSWAIWNGDNIFVNTSLIITMLANTIVNIYSAAIYEPLEQPSATDNAMSVSAVFLSFGVNLLATCLIYLKAWMHRRTKKAAFSEEKHVRRSDVDRVLLLIIESGAVYCLVQLIYPILNTTALYTPDLAPDGALATAINVFGPIYSGITVIYPMAVIILIHSRRSVVVEVTRDTIQASGSDGSSSRGPTTPGIRSGDASQVLSTLRFAPSNSITDDTGTRHTHVGDVEMAAERDSGDDVGMKKQLA